MLKDALTLPAELDTQTAHLTLARNVLVLAGASLILAISAQVAVPMPFSLVPFTLQPLALLLIGAALGSRRGAAAALLYIIEGAIGLPFFAQGRGGPAVLLGPTAGYLLAFPVTAFIAGYASEKGWLSSIPRSFVAMTAALAVVYLSGWSWLATGMGLGARSAFFAGVTPFVLADLVKIALAASLFSAIRAARGKGSLPLSPHQGPD